MNEQLTLEDVTSIVLATHESKYESGIPPTAYNKLLFLIDKELNKKSGVDVDIPFYWYMHGPAVKTANTNVNEVSVGDGKRIQCDTKKDQITAPSHVTRKVEESAESALEIYYEGGLDGLIAEAYRHAPYDVNNIYRDMKQQLATETNSDQASLADFTGTNQTQLRNIVHDFVRAFPVEEFPRLEDDLHIWYRLVSAELDADDFDAENTKTLTQQFWRLFCLELACKENNDVSREEIEADLNTVSTSIADEKNRHRDRLRDEERVKARRNATGSEMALKASEAVMLPQLEFTAEL